MKPSEDKENSSTEAIHLEDNKPAPQEDSAPEAGNSLEASDGGSDEPVVTPPESPLTTPETPKPTESKKVDDGKGSFVIRVRRFVKRFDIYLLIFILVTVVALILAGVALNKNGGNKTPIAGSQSLSQAALSQLNSNDTSVGSSQQTLNIESNSIFASNVLVKGGLEVAGSVTFASNLSIPGLTVSGNSTFGQISGSNLTLSGNSTLNGNLTVKQGLSVSGSGSFSGSLTAPSLAVSSLQVNGDFQIGHHLSSTGSIPKDSGGTLGSGGTTSVSGNDTAGTVNIGVGSGVSGNQCLATITFASNYSSTPHVIVTPVGSASGNIGFYITDTSSGFTICGNSVSAGSLSFNYFVID